MDCPGSMAHAEMSEWVLFTTAMLHRFGLPYNWRTSSPRNPVHAARLLSGTLVCTPLGLIASLLGNVTRGDAEGMAADYRPMRSLKWLSNASSSRPFPPAVVFSWLLLFSLNPITCVKTDPARGISMQSGMVCTERMW